MTPPMTTMTTTTLATLATTMTPADPAATAIATTSATATATAADRGADLERRLGDPYDPSNPFGFAAFEAADERAELLADGEQLLDEWGFNAEFVPLGLGGRLDTADDLARVLRPVFRRDASLGLGYGVTSLMAAVNVWTAGSPRQQEAMAQLLLGGGRASVAFHELGHGNDLLGNDFRASLVGGRMVLTGSKHVINNVDRAGALVLFARTAEAAGARSHSVLAVPAGTLPADRVRLLPRYPTSGVRGCRLGGIVFDGAEVGADTVVGRLGSGVETALKAFQVTRAVLPGMALGAVDASVHSVLRFARARRLYRVSVSDLPHARATLVAAFVDLLVADCLATVATRGLHLLPHQSSGYAAAVKFCVPALAEDAMNSLATVLGARSFLRSGEYAAVGRHLRDLPLLAIGHAGGTACLLTIMPQLPALARRSWLAEQGTPAPDALFDTGAALPPLDLSRLRVAGNGEDGLGLALLHAADDPELGESAELRRLVGELADRLRRLGKEALAAPPGDGGPTAGPAAFGRARECALLWAAAACLGTWRVHRARGTEFLGDTAWVTAALGRVANRLSGRHRPLPPSADHVLFTEMLGRLAAGQAFSLDPAPVSG